MLGLFCRCRVKAVYAAHALAVELLLPDERPSREWLVVCLPILPPLAKRKIQVDDVPAFLPKRMMDPDWSTDSEIEQFGPCPRARRSVVALLTAGKSLAVHIPQTEHWLASIGPGATLRGDLIVDDNQRLSDLIIAANIARAAD